jgi:Ca2+:H+ antiporter
MIINSHGDKKESVRTTILSLSRGTAIILLLLYVLYLWFQLRTHHNLFHDPATLEAQARASENDAEAESHEVAQQQPQQQQEDDEEPHMSPWAAAGVLIVTTLLVSVCADYLVESIDSLVERAHISRNFIGLILIPIVGNAAEHVTAVVVAVKNKMDLVRILLQNSLARRH